MSQWKNTDTAGNSVNYAAKLFQAGSGKSDIAANNTALYINTTPDAFVNGVAVGQFGVSATEAGVTSAEGKKVAHAGWNIRKAFEGPVISYSIVTPGAGFANGETLKLSNGSVNAVLTITTNTGTSVGANIVSVNVTTKGRFTNNSMIKYDFTREQHVKEITVTGGTGYDNTDYIIVSNTGAGGVNAVATIVTDGDGVFTNSDITITNVGLFVNATMANTNLVLDIYAANGAASNGSSATLVGNLATSSSGNVVAVLGGRAGRVQYETLVAMKSISGDASDDTYLPES